MNNETLNFLEAMASKLGTTAEYLWQVLLQQAPIQAGVDLLILLATLFAAYKLYKAHVRFCNNEYEFSYYNNEAFAVVVAIVALFLFILLVYGVLSLPSIITGFFNPEYWALREILDSVK